VETRPGELIFKIRDGRCFVLKPKDSKGADSRPLREEAKKPARAPLGRLPAFPPEKLRDVFENSAALQVVWERACESVCARSRILVRANRLQDLLCELGTTRYRMQCRGLAPVCHLGIHTTLYALADVLAHYVCSACDEDNRIGHDRIFIKPFMTHNKGLADRRLFLARASADLNAGDGQKLKYVAAKCDGSAVTLRHGRRAMPPK
jgi:hypothetical protein